MSDHVVQRLYDLAARSPDSPAFATRRAGGEWQTRTLGELTSTVRRLSNALIYERLLPSEAAVVMGPPGPSWFVGHLSVLAASGVCVPVDETSSDEEIIAIVRETEARIVLVAGARARASIERIRRRLTSLRLVVDLDDETGDVGDGYDDDGEDLDDDIVTRGHFADPMLRASLPADDAQREGPEVVPLSRLEQLPYDLATAAEARRRAEAWHGSDIAAVHYVAAANGTLRGVVMTHASTLYPVDAVLAAVELPDELSLVAWLPLTQGLAYCAALVVLLNGGIMWCPAPGENLSDVMVEVRPTIAVSTMHTIEALLDAALDDVRSRLALSDELVDWATGIADQVESAHAAGRALSPQLAVSRRAAEVRVLGPIRARLGGRRRLTLIGGQAMPSPELMTFLRHLDQAPSPVWGALETGPIATVEPPGVAREGSVGRPLPGTEIRIDDHGKVEVRGPGVMRGYYGRPAETLEALSDGWYHSGQPGRLDASGTLYLTSRVDDVILTSNLRYTSARPIERMLEESPLVSHAVVVGEARPVLTALVHPDPTALRHALRESGAEREDSPLEMLLRDPRAVRLVGDAVRRINATLPPHQQLAGFRLIATPPGTTSVTGASMTRRERALQDHAEIIESMYADLEAARSRHRG